MKCETNKYVYNIREFEAIRFFDDSNFSGKVTIIQAEENQSNPLENIVEFKRKSGPRKNEGKKKK